ncbi:hypothetical protein I7I51_00701 [Histoplasma capsulatum]|uniref:Uncharacterized protein n=1 Tax=Ajellomyces capsulatus TaxID=5037 RepID=A0A8A1MGG1_AJECA|nr:hypothetical protein I7I51_00701 [Histoplasma capsulatum]
MEEEEEELSLAKSGSGRYARSIAAQPPSPPERRSANANRGRQSSEWVKATGSSKVGKPTPYGVGSTSGCGSTRRLDPLAGEYLMPLAICYWSAWVLLAVAIYQVVFYEYS